jgi:hypothetical protein
VISYYSGSKGDVLVRKGANIDNQDYATMGELKNQPRKICRLDSFKDEGEKAKLYEIFQQVRQEIVDDIKKGCFKL